MFILKSFLCASTLTFVHALTSSLQPFTGNFGPNPTNVSLYSYTPTTLASPAPLIVALHYCSETAKDYFGRSTLPQLADQHGFILIFPDTPSFGGCWDISSNATLAHNAGGDSLGIASMVRYAIANWKVDPTRVFATGASSGAVMTSVLLGAYPDLFAAGTLYSGVPFGCFAALNPYSNSQCATGQIVQTPQQWGNEVRVAMPGFSGTRPRVQFWHGSADTGIFVQNFWEEIKQWTNVFGVSQTPTSNLTGDPEAIYSRASFGPNVQALLAQGLGHTVPEHDTETINWFGLATVVPSGSPPISTSSTSAPSPSSIPVQVHFGQCGGTGWSGPTVCASPFTCKVSNPFFSQCL